MEAEVINQLNNTLNDLEKRSEDIRVYMDYQGKKTALKKSSASPKTRNSGTTPNAPKKSAKSAKSWKVSC